MSLMIVIMHLLNISCCSHFVVFLHQIRLRSCCFLAVAIAHEYLKNLKQEILTLLEDL